MSVYFFVLLPVLLISLLTYTKKVSSSVLLFCFVFIFVLAAIRFNLGRDYDTYVKMFYMPEKIGTSEIGFMLINRALNYTGFSVQAVIIFYAFVTQFFAYQFIKRESPNTALSLLIYFSFTPFYLETLNTIRQGAAIYIFLYAIKYIKERKLFKYCLFIITAAVFAHSSVLITLPLYFLLNKEYTLKARMLLLAILVGVNRFIEILIKYTPYAKYLSVLEVSNTIAPLTIIGMLICSYLFIKYYYSNEMILSNLNYIYICISVLCILNRSSIIYLLLDRINHYFLPAIIILIPLYFKSKTKTIVPKVVCYYALIIGFSLLFILSIYYKGSENQLVPYHVFFGKNFHDLI